VIKEKFVFILLVVLLLMICFVPPSMVQEVKTKELSTFTSPTLGAKFVLVPSGTFTMGSPTREPGRDGDETQHQVVISHSFYMQTTEVTQGQWKRVMGSNPSFFPNCGNNCPVESVSWNDVQEFISKLSSMEGTNKYRLPTEAEWEYAARAGTQTPFNTGACLSSDQANYDGHYPLAGCPKGEYRNTTISVASFSANSWGLFDMHGNVWEWCQDWKGSYPNDKVTDPAGQSSGSRRVNRGGSWRSFAKNARTASRGSHSPSYKINRLGFRLLRIQ
jgi:formylglycine-generating enzyme